MFEFVSAGDGVGGAEAGVVHGVRVLRGELVADAEEPEGGVRPGHHRRAGGAAAQGAQVGIKSRAKIVPERAPKYFLPHILPKLLKNRHIIS